MKQQKLIIVEGAIVDKISNKKVKFYKNKVNSVWGTILSDWAERNKMNKASSDIIYINEVDFYGCLKRYGVPYYLKIDIEGMDLHCCKTLLSFNEKPDYISIESEKKDFKLLLDEIQLLEKLGYDKFKMFNRWYFKMVHLETIYQVIGYEGQAKLLTQKRSLK